MTAQRILEITRPSYETARLNYCKGSINIVRDGYNEILIHARAGGNILVQLRYGSKRDEIAQLLEAHSIQYSDKLKCFIFAISIERAMKEVEFFSQIANLNNRWWVGIGNGS